MANIKDHQYAGDARNPFSFGGAGEGLIRVHTDWATDNLATDDQQRVYKVAKAGFVSEFALTSSAMDTHATPTLTFDVGTQADDDEFIAAAVAGATELTNTASTGTATEAGFPVAAGDYIILSVKAGAATAVAGTTDLSFRFTASA